MKIKKFTAATMKEALLKVKAELGEDAMILKSRKLPASLIPMGGGDRVEVTAAVDEDNLVIPARMPEIPVNTGGSNREFLARLKHLPADGAKESYPASTLPRVSVPPMPPKLGEIVQAVKEPTPPVQETVQIMKIHDELAEMKRLLASILATGESRASGGYAGPWSILYKRLVDSEIRDVLARDLLDRLKETTPNPGKEIGKAFLHALASGFPVSATESSRIQLFVGPTGSGKTTTIAKLAAYFSLEKRKKVSLITADTYRIAAIDQLRAYAEIVGIDLYVVFRPEELPEILAGCESSDIILVDTAGRSQKHREHMDELNNFAHALKPDCTHLVLSATTKESDLIDLVRRYRAFGLDRLLFTKLDETVRLGNVYNVVNDVAIPVSYFTFGQSVPDDIETAQAAVFVKKLLEGSSL